MCVYTHRTNEETTIVIIYVDDAIAASSKKETLEAIVVHIGSEFKMKSLPQTRFVGLNMTHDRPNKRLFLSQSHTISKLTDRFGVADVKHPSRPECSSEKIVI